MYSGILLSNFLFYIPATRFETYNLIIKLVESFFGSYRVRHLMKVTHITHPIMKHILPILSPDAHLETNKYNLDGRKETEHCQIMKDYWKTRKARTVNERKRGK